MEVKVEALAGEAGRCRCCYSEVEGGKRLERQYSHVGVQEVYAHMLKETFSIVLCQGRCDEICESCVLRLRDASSFRELVLRTEQRILHLLPGNSKPHAQQGLVLKVEAPDESVDAEEYNWDTDYQDSDDYIEEQIPPKVEKVKKEPARAPAASGVFKPAARNIQDMLIEKSKPSKTSILAKLLTGKAKLGEKRNIKLSHSINTFKTLVGQPLSTTRSSETSGKAKAVPKVTGKLLNATKSNALVCKLLGPRSKPELKSLSKSSLNVKTILKALSCRGKARPSTKPEGVVKTEPTHRKAVGAAPLDAPSFERRTERQIVKHNVIALIKHTTVCPFISHRGNFKCLFCGETFFSFGLLQSHVDGAHGDVATAARRIYTFKDILHVDVTDLKCRGCRKDFPDVETVKEHLVKEHQVKINMKHKDDVIQFKLGGADSYRCHLCDEQFHVFRNLSLHMNVHYPNYMCDVCGKAFISARRCHSHEKSHKTGAYPCSKCDKVFPSINSRNAHTLEHRVTKYRCPQCPERFNKYLERTVHMSQVVIVY